MLDYHLRPLVRAPHLVVCGAGQNLKQTHALPLSAVSPAEWVRLEDKLATFTSVVVRDGELMRTQQLDCSLLSPRTGRWRDGPPLPNARRHHCSAQLRGVSVVCGGVKSGALSSTLLLPAGDAPQWNHGCEMTTARSCAGSTVVTAADASPHRMLVVGGMNDDLLNSCEMYDGAADRWSMLEARLPQAICCRAAPIAGGSGVLAMQWDDWKKTIALLDLRSRSSSWQEAASAENPRWFHAVTAVGEHSVVRATPSHERTQCNCTTFALTTGASARSGVFRFRRRCTARL